MLAALTLGTLASLASAGVGAYASAKANKRANELIDTQRKENKQWYEIEKATDYSKRADNQAILQKQKELLDAHYKRSAAANAVAGGTDEALALQQQAAANSVAETASNMAMQSEQHRENVEQAYRQADAALNQQQAQAEQNKANAIAQAAGQGVSAGLGIIGSALGQGANPVTPTATAAPTIQAPTFTLNSNEHINKPQPLPEPK